MSYRKSHDALLFPSEGSLPCRAGVRPLVAKDRMDLFETEDGIEDRLQTVRGNGRVHLDAASNAQMENRDRGKEMRGPTRT